MMSLYPKPTNFAAAIDNRHEMGRPTYSYIAMIAFAILNAPEKKVTVKGIYEFIMRHFPYLCRSDNKKSWQNTVRYTLSYNDCFVKVPNNNEDCDGCNKKHGSTSRQCPHV